MSRNKFEAIKKSDRITYIVTDDEIRISTSHLRLCFIEIYDKAFSQKEKKHNFWSKLLWSSLSVGLTLLLTLCTCDFKSFQLIASATLKDISVGICVFAWLSFIISCIVLVSIDAPDTRDVIIGEAIESIKSCCSTDDCNSYQFRSS